MSHRTRRTPWLLAVGILALALPEVSAARGDQTGSGNGSHVRSGHSGQAGRSVGRSQRGGGSQRGRSGERGNPGFRKRSTSSFERYDHRSSRDARSRSSRSRDERARERSDRTGGRDDRVRVRSDRTGGRDDRVRVRSDHSRGHDDRSYASRERNHLRHDGGHVRYEHHGDSHHRYPRHGHRVHHLPKNYVTISIGGHYHYYHHGIWYRPWGFGLGYVIATAPLGAVVAVLPPFYTTFWYYGVPYYYANYTYYRWSPVHDGYLVVEDPGVNAEEFGSEELFVYPNAGQSEEQQADDRYACHRWAVDETGYDPSLVDPADDASDLAGLRDDYQRALSACLEGRDYTVR